MKNTRGNQLIVAVGVVGTGVALLIVGIFLWFASPFFLAHGKMTKEMRNLNVPGVIQEHQEYRSGVCFDNCPVLVATYKITPTALVVERSEVVTSLRALGYMFDSPHAGDSWITARKDKFQFRIGFGKNPSTLPIEDSSKAAAEDRTIIDNIVVTLEHMP